MEHEKGAFGGLSTSLKAELEPQHADLLLFACCLTSGLVDSTIYRAYNTFVSMQTGNTIFVGLGASHQNLRPYGWARSLTSIGCFILGSFIFARLHRVLGPRRRVSLILSFLLQASIILLTAGLVQGGAVSSTLAGKGSQTAPPWDQEVPIVLLSIQAAGQIVASRALGYNEIPTVVITSLLCDLMSDPQLFLIRNVKRDRRIIAFVLTLVGAIVGGWVTKVTGGVAPILWLSAGIKGLLVLAWAFWKAK
ncbi:Protein of unknown function DUF1275 [Penicillium expansum]|uniref:DUF1275 domain protein n=1 Tax=Penicillium expansum TaxID=27334 RepID=A0A0A2K3X3_PENEN|nr:Protein of unknown function DUF1275 [Penicillium expansum]KGO38162.1 Protein of unknown function DUF1275 [Penicillium expansum]KGO51252.1 Protein of unknown function DUF1275 [Penicillium expansum]KGO61736.1 Protein of unknown function DUF1275 [Penicillium expansum]